MKFITIVYVYALVLATEISHRLTSIRKLEFFRGHRPGFVTIWIELDLNQAAGRSRPGVRYLGGAWKASIGRNDIVRD